MSSVGSAGSNMMRITGMATGMDTDAMVKAMTANYQLKIDKVNQEKQIMQWKQEMYRDIITDIKDIQDYFDPISDKYILSESKFSSVKVTNSNENAIGFTAGATAIEGTYKLNVTKLAEAAVVDGAAITATSGTATKLKDINGSLEGKTVTFDINGNTVDIAVDADTTIQNVLDTLNNDTNISADATATFDELTKKFVFKTNASGSTKNLSVTLTDNDAGDLVSSLGFAEGVASLDSGQNAEFSITYPDGRSEIITNQESNKFTANGVTYNLKTAGTGDTTITVEKNDTDKVFDNIKSFIDDYNNLMEKIQSKLSEKKQYDYKPLSTEQKESMSEEDIKTWEIKAKQGILKNDSYLGKLMTDLRGTLFAPVYSDKASDSKNEYHMGIYGEGALWLDTSSDMTQLGKILIKDETKLKEAISNNVEEFTKFFIGKSSTENLDDKYIGTDTYYEDGLFTRINKIVETYAGDPGIGKDGKATLKGTLNIYANKQYDFSITGGASQNTIPDQIYRKTVSTDQLNRRMIEVENKYYAQFARLESAMNQMNSQMSSFYSQMGMG
ncbi:flagellar filament capping protein FliD [Oceanirhabdus sp. W0125-5]|uniref:flagellar filament capping protein FliD n=1 Tax=Oceanirhabdus sp. W0125-5 TaxID=2999116 RepID=UPI0022F3052F|nr:flagellar filament capping protein FliD [Oceanirhabdus sp. W0125-5]WBW95465.1 flagellar filament capping protein FliD [Oceanirhabdus sp. W0125-5]